MSRWHYSTNDTLVGNAPDAYGVAQAFAEICYNVDYFIFNNAAIIQRRRADDVGWDDEIEIPADTIYCTGATTQAIRIRNQTAGDVARYSIVGWY